HAVLSYASPAGMTEAERAAAAGVGAPAPADALAIGGAADGDSGPLRRALAALGGALLTGAAPSAAASPEGTEETLTSARSEALARLVERLAAPAVSATIVAGDVARVTVAPASSPPLPLTFTSAAAALADGPWTFLVARALEDARGGWLALRGLDARARTELLTGAQAGLLGETPDGERARAAAKKIADAGETFAAGDVRTRLIADLADALSKPLDWDAAERAAAHTANRVGLLACGSVADALAALAREDALLAKAGADAPLDARRSFLRTNVVRELVRFAFSPAFALGAAGDR
ncbi:MAG TPA: hypothetical protein VHJ20_15730, partial [Polyangia bacterium]|nr:hypothetical protein [Polyangia bacterium]